MLSRLAIVLLPLVALIGACGATAEFALQPPIAGFVPPGAHDIRVQQVGLGQRVLMYQAVGARYDWYFTVATRLQAAGWVPPDKWGPPSQINTYTHVTPLWVGFLWEQAELHGQPHQARITLRRWVTIPWKQYIRYVK